MKKATKKVSKRTVTAVTALDIEDHDTGELQIRTAGGAQRNEAYMGIIAKMEKYKKPGKSFTINVPKGRTLKGFHHSLNSLFSRYAPKMHPGLSYAKGTTVDDKVVISIIKEGDKRPRGVRQPTGKKTPKAAARTASKPKARSRSSKPAVGSAASGDSGAGPATAPQFDPAGQ